jgi:hypothetical protein
VESLEAVKGQRGARNGNAALEFLLIGSEGMGHQPVKMEPAFCETLDRKKKIFLIESLL